MHDVGIAKVVEIESLDSDTMDMDMGACQCHVMDCGGGGREKQIFRGKLHRMYCADAGVRYAGNCLVS